MVGFNTYRLGWDNDPFADLERMNREFQHLFAGSKTGNRSELPVNVWANDDEAVVTVEVPGVEASDIELEVQDHVLTIRAERRTGAMGENERYHRRERTQGKIARSISLPYEVEAEQVHANANLGVLTIRLPRSAATRPRKISVNAS